MVKSSDLKSSHFPHKFGKKEVSKIYLFRHGQTTYNAKNIFTGWKDPSLTKKGIVQAKRVAWKLKNKEIEVAFRSRLSRSKDTLKIVLKHHSECKKIIEDNRIIERRYGILEGTTHEAFIKRIGKKLGEDLAAIGDSIENLGKKERKKADLFLGEQEYNAIHRGYNVKVPGGESFADVEKRVESFVEFLKKFVKKNKVNVAISAHGNSIRLFRKIWENASKEEAIKWIIPYDKVYEYEIRV
ncbi:MAG: histidine phosphatase family protein [Nanoarchaeota archaeon]